MVTSNEDILQNAQQLPPEERCRLRDTLTVSLEQDPFTSTRPQTTGAAFVRALRLRPPLDPAAADELERLIEEGCERIDPETW